MVDRPDFSKMFDAHGSAVAAPCTDIATTTGRNEVSESSDVRIARPDWASTTSDHDNDHIVDGLGYSASLLAKFQRAPDGFEANDARLVVAAGDFLECPDTPKGFDTAFDELPVSLQAKALEELWTSPHASLDALYQKLKRKLTLAEAAAARRFMIRLGRRE
jgi:hypothetical protein